MSRLRKHAALLAILTALPLLSACGDRPKTDQINARLLELRNSPQGRIEPLPQFPEPLTAEYSQQRQRDPFTPSQLQVQLQQIEVTSTPAPDMNRPRTALEQWDLDQLSFRGSMQKGSDIRALVMTPDNRLHTVRLGDKMGRDHGTVSHIDPEQITLQELISTRVGQWQEREQYLLISR